VAYRLYLPKDWAEDKARRHKTGVPEEIGFKTKPEIALEHIRWAHAIGLPGDMVVLDAGYGNDAKLRGAITELEKVYVAGRDRRCDLTRRQSGELHLGRIVGRLPWRCIRIRWSLR
jgi:SRSO17 transposase